MDGLTVQVCTEDNEFKWTNRATNIGGARGGDQTNGREVNYDSSDKLKGHREWGPDSAPLSSWQKHHLAGVTLYPDSGLL